MALKYADRLESNNPKAYGIVKGTEVSGFKVVQSLDKLYTIPDCILSGSGENTDSDAIGQEWFVTAEGKYYKLIEWDFRHRADGWKEMVEMTAPEKTKLVGIEEGAQVNIISGVSVVGTALTPDSSTKVVDIPAATQEAPGILSSTDKIKLDKIVPVVTIINYNSVLAGGSVTEEQYGLIKDAVLRKDIIIIDYDGSIITTVMGTQLESPESGGSIILYISETATSGLPDMTRKNIIIKPDLTVEVVDRDTIPLASITTSGGVKLGYSENGRNYSLRLDQDGKGYVNVSWDSNYPSVNAATTVTQFSGSIHPNLFYKWPTPLTSLTITALNVGDYRYLNEYIFSFKCPADSTTALTIPETVKWVTPPLLEPGKTYVVSIIENLAVIGGA